MYFKKSAYPFIILYILSVLLFQSCVSSKNITYFQNLPNESYIRKKQAVYLEPLIQQDDILSISIQTIDPQNSAIINQVSPTAPSLGASSASLIGQQQISGFLVDKDGYVELPMIGKLKLLGLSTFSARELVREKASVFYKNVTVQVRFINFKVGVIGEVAKPGFYILPNEKVTILDALGLAGDLTIYGKRENVLLMREVDGEKEYARLNLNSTDMLESPYYYLKQNDVIYVEPNKSKIATTDAARTRTITIIGSVVSVALVLLTRIK